MLNKEQRAQVFQAAFNAFMQDLTRQTGFTLAAVLDVTRETGSLAITRARIEVVPIENWEPPKEEVQEVSK